MKSLRNAFLTALAAGGFITITLLLPDRGVERDTPLPPSRTSVLQRIIQPDRDLLRKVTPPRNRVEKEGIAIALLMDTSSSMEDKARDANGSMREKIEIARNVAWRVLGRIKMFNEKYPWVDLKVGVYQFSGDECRQLLPLEAFNFSRAMDAVELKTSSQGTPMGEAILQAKLDLDRSGLRTKHILVVTDGDNSKGIEPARVSRAIDALRPADRAGIHFLTIDMDSSDYQEIRRTGKTILKARNAADLDRSIDQILEEGMPATKRNP